jgi:TolA-binding protein
MNEINRLADFILKYYGQEIGLGNPIEGESAVDVAIRLLTPQSSPSVTDLLANLARRVSSLEQQLSATQSNVEKLAEELANVEHLTESNEQDIAMLDERTQPTEEPVTPDESIPQYWAEALIRFYGGNR